MLDWCQRIEGTDNYIVTRPTRWRQWTLEVGFIFNISVPWWLKWLQSRHDPELLRGSAIHDFLLKLGVDPAIAAAHARIIMRVDGASAQKSWRTFFAMLFWTAFDDENVVYEG
jgi:hypothetical protein